VDAAVSRVADMLGVAWWTIMRQVVARGRALVDDPQRLAGVAAAGVDETAYLRGSATRATTFAAGIAEMSPGRPARLLDLVEGRSGTALAGWLAERDPAWRAGSRRRRWTRSGAAPPPARPTSRARCACWTRSTSFGSSRPRSMTFAAGCSRTRPVTAAAPATRSTASAACCAVAPITSARRRGPLLETGLVTGDRDGEVTLAWTIAQRVMARPSRASSGIGQIRSAAMSSAACVRALSGSVSW
jgi:hypothetical protein